MTNEEMGQKITDEIAKTEKLIIGYKDMSAPVSPDVAIGRVSRMDAINNKAVAEAALRQAEGKLHKLKYLLTRVGHPEFGICLKCKTPIPLGRILVRPESMHCVNCAQ